MGIGIFSDQPIVTGSHDCSSLREKAKYEEPWPCNFFRGQPPCQELGEVACGLP